MVPVSLPELAGGVNAAAAFILTSSDARGEQDLVDGVVDVPAAACSAISTPHGDDATDRAVVSFPAAAASSVSADPGAGADAGADTSAAGVPITLAETAAASEAAVGLAEAALVVSSPAALPLSSLASVAAQLADTTASSCESAGSGTEGAPPSLAVAGAALPTTGQLQSCAVEGSSPPAHTGSPKNFVDLSLLPDSDGSPTATVPKQRRSRNGMQEYVVASVLSALLLPVRVMISMQLPPLIGVEDFLATLVSPSLWILPTVYICSWCRHILTQACWSLRRSFTRRVWSLT